MTDRAEFLYNSLNDIQGTIRAIDAKFFGIFAILLLPLTELEEISESFKFLYNVHPSLTLFFCGLLIICWALGIVVCLMGIYAIGNPKNRLKENKALTVKGLFYQPTLFNVTMLNQFFPWCITSKETLENLVKEFDVDDKAIFNELVFEQAKLVYIRDLKMSRQQLSIFFLLATTLIIAGSLVITLALGNNA